MDFEDGVGGCWEVVTVVIDEALRVVDDFWGVDCGFCLVVEIVNDFFIVWYCAREHSQTPGARGHGEVVRALVEEVKRLEDTAQVIVTIPVVVEQAGF